MTKEELMQRVPGLDEETAIATIKFLDDDFLRLCLDGKINTTVEIFNALCKEP